jgi:ribosome biogenesis GTPase / thiamine phosphate phosphatase
MRQVDAMAEEEAFHGNDNKLGRKERKLAQAADRSKYKKTDMQKKVTKQYTGNGIRGRVLSITREGMHVETVQGNYTCSLRGALKKEKTLSKNLIAVGDFVYTEPQDENFATIVHIEERKSVLSRADNLRRRQEHLIATNIDQVFIVISLFLPRLKPFLVDRYIIAAQKGNMQPIIVLNKIDLLDNPPCDWIESDVEEERELYEEFLASYTHAPIIEVSATCDAGLDKLRKQMEGKSSVFSGQSGVGKTSLINAMLGTDLPIGDIALHKRKGTHTTSTPKLISLGKDSFCVDTPGIKSFGLWNYNKEELQSFFPEIASEATGCHFPNCNHLHEPKCAVKEAVTNNTISNLRYESFITLLTNSE